MPQRYVSVTLAVPYDETTEDHPSTWDWTTLVDSLHDVIVTDSVDLDPAAPLHDLHGNRVA